jgi:hypothetical protein
VFVAVFNNRTFFDEEVAIDGNEFTDCLFNECNMHYAGGTAFFKGKCRFQKCQWSFSGAAHNTVLMLRYIHALPPVGLPELKQPEKDN